MNQAREQAMEACRLKEVPVGACVVHEGKVIARAYNQRESRQNPLLHAEIQVISEASSHLGTWRLQDCEIFVTLEPCMMCLGAIVQSRIRRLVYACSDPRGNLKKFQDHLPPSLKVESGLQEEACSRLLKEFFKQLREEKS